MYEQQCEAVVRNTFSSVKQALLAREAQLLSEFDQLHSEKKESALEFHEQNLRELAEHTEIHSKLLETLKPISEKAAVLREIPKLPAAASSFALLPAQGLFTLDTSRFRSFLSSQFSVKARNPDERVLRRTKITRALKWRYPGDRLDAITFTVSRNVYLSGVGLCMPYKPGQSTKIRAFSIRKGPATDSPVEYQHPRSETMNFDPQSSVYKLSLHVLLKKNTKYTVTFSITGSPTYKCVDCQTEIQEDNGLKWRFYDAAFAAEHATNRCDCICGPIADFFYIPAS